MSQSDYNAEIVETYQALISGKRAVYAAIALGLYDFVLTLQDEQSLVWHNKWTGSTWILIVNRILMLATAVWTAAPFNAQGILANAGVSRLMADWLCRCHSIATRVSDSAIALAPAVVAAAFSALRVYALTEYRLIVTGIVILISLVPFGTNLFVDVQRDPSFIDDPILGPTCAYTYALPPLLLSQLSIATRLSAIAADAVVVTVTWQKTFKHCREASKLGMHVGLSATLLRDGSIYFIVLLLMNLAQLLNIAVPSWNQSSEVPPLNSMIQFIVISRFIINLRRVSSPGSLHSTVGHISRFSVPNFRMPTIASVIGDMGEPLGHCEAVEEEPDTWEVELVRLYDAESDKVEWKIASDTV